MSILRSPVGPAVGTIIARNYLSHARVLFRSYLEHHPGAHCYLLVVDGLPDGVEMPKGIRVIDPGELRCRDFRSQAFQYNVVELSTSVKPAFLEFLFERHREESVLYLDPDILVLRRLKEARAALRKYSILLTPHHLEPLASDGKTPTEDDPLFNGVFNLGFLGLRKSSESHSLLSWWQQRLKRDCRDRPYDGLFFDQRWADLVPSLFPSVAVLHDETYNVASWNLATRMVEGKRGEFRVNGKPLSFFHFSGFQIGERRFRPEWGNRLELRPGTPLAELCDLYAEHQKAEGHAESRLWEYGFSRFDDGKAIDGIMRETYWRLAEEARVPFGDPFRTRGPNSFRQWALTPDPDLQGWSPFLRTLSDMRTDVREALPDIDGKDREAFLTWARDVGSRQMKFDPAFVRGEP